MNKPRRKHLEEIVEQLKSLYDDLEQLLEEEQEALDNMPEAIQYSDRGEYAQTKIDTIGDAQTSLESAIDNLNEVLGE